MGKLIATLLLACFFVGMARAGADDMGSSLSLRGFGTVGLARSSSDDAEFVRDLSQPVGIKGGQWSGRIDSILGLQANWQATPEVELVGQVVSRLHYDRSHNPELMWAFAKWEPDQRVSLRAGRIGADFMMLADSRLVGYSYLPVRPSGDFFGPLFFSHFDGGDISVTFPLGGGLVRGKLFSGDTQEKNAGKLGVWNTDGSIVRGMVIDYLQGNWQFRANTAQIRFAENMNTAMISIPLFDAGNSGIPQATAAAESLIAKGTVTRFYSAGVVYDRGPLQIQAMVNQIIHETRLFQNSRAGFLLLGYRLGSFIPYLGVSSWKTSSRKGLPIIPVASLNEAYRSFVSAADVDRNTYTIGARWNFDSQMALKVQWDFVRANADTGFSFANVKPEWNGKTGVLSVTLDFVF